MTNEKEKRDAERLASVGRRPFEPPQIKSLGSVTELTGGAVGGLPDGEGGGVGAS